MVVLANALYDPAAAVSKDTSAAIALVEIDTTNLRLAFAAPITGRVLVRMCGVLHGATTFPQIFLGIREAGVTKARVVPTVKVGGTALATTRATAEAFIVISGLSAGTHTFDASYGVDVGVASTGLKYGGPSDTTADNAFGGFVFDILAA